MTRGEWHDFASRETLAEALADRVADVLAAAVAKCGHATLAVSGGTTPGLFFDALSNCDIAWGNVTVTLVDERFVPETSGRSNAALTRSRLLTHAAKAARALFVPLYHGEGSPAQSAAAASVALAPLLPLDAAILGMGTDGHTASFFPDAMTLGDLIDPNNPAIVLPVEAVSAGEPRLTLTLARLLDARFLALHIEGAEKRAVLEQALKPKGNKPVSAVFAHAKAPVPVYWAG